MGCIMYILSQEGTTQGDNCASAFYCCSLMPLLDILPTEPPDIPPGTPEDTDPEKPSEKPPEKPPETPPEKPPETTPEAEKPPDKAAKHIRMTLGLQKSSDPEDLVAMPYSYLALPTATTLN